MHKKHVGGENVTLEMVRVPLQHTEPLLGRIMDYLWTSNINSNIIPIRLSVHEPPQAVTYSNRQIWSNLSQTG